MDFAEFNKRLPMLWYMANNCKICGEFTKDYEWAITSKICKKCIDGVQTDYEKEIQDECTFDEYIDALVTAALLTKDW